MITAQEVRQEVENAFVDARAKKVLLPQLIRVRECIRYRVEAIKEEFQLAKCGNCDFAWNDLTQYSEFSKAYDAIVVDVPERLYPENREFLEGLGYTVIVKTDWTLIEVYFDR